MCSRPDGSSTDYREPKGEPSRCHFRVLSLSERRAVASGSFAMTGNYEGNGVTLNQAHWIHQPLGYVMVSLQGQVSSANLSGSIIGPGCSTFSVSRATPAQPHGGSIVTAGPVWVRVTNGQTLADYGVVLHNTSAELSALGIGVTLTVSGGDYGPTSHETEVTGIPPLGWFYLSPGLPLAGTANVSAGLTVTPSVSVARTVRGHVQMPSVTVDIKQVGPLPEAVGVVRNTYPHPDESNWGDITTGYFSVIYFNARGKIVGAESEDPNYDFRSTSFSSPTRSFTLSDTPVGATNAKASIDPCSSGSEFWGLSRACVALQ